MNPAGFPRAVRDSRIAKNLTQREAAALLGVAALTVSAWERGAKTPPPKIQARHLRVLRVTKRRQKRASAEGLQQRATARARLGRILRAARIKAGLTQPAAAKLVPCTVSQLCDYEGGRNSPSSERLIRLREVYANAHH